MRLSLTFLIALLMTLAASVARADEMTSAKRADIKSLMLLNGTSDIATQMANIVTGTLAAQLRAAGRNDVPVTVLQSARDDLVGLLKGRIEAPGSLREKIEDAYGKAFTHQDIKDLAAFFRTATGKKWVAVTGQLARDTGQEMQASANLWREEIERAVNERMRKEGVDLSKSKAAPTPSPTQPKPAPAQPK